MTRKAVLFAALLCMGIRNTCKLVDVNLITSIGPNKIHRDESPWNCCSYECSDGRTSVSLEMVSATQCHFQYLILVDIMKWQQVGMKLTTYWMGNGLMQLLDYIMVGSMLI